MSDHVRVRSGIAADRCELPHQERAAVHLRVFRIKGFPNHLAFYLERANGIEIVHVAHGARDLDAVLQDE